MGPVGEVGRGGVGPNELGKLRNYDTALHHNHAQARLMVKNLSELHLVRSVDHFLRQSVDLVIQNFGQALRLDAVSAATRIPLAGPDLGQSLRRFYVQARSVDCVAAVGKIFNAKLQKPWSSHELYNLMLELLAAVPANDTFSAHHLGISAANTQFTKDGLQKTASLLVSISQVSQIFAWVGTRFLAEKEQLARDGMLKDDVEAAMSFCRQLINRVLHDLEVNPTGFGPLTHYIVGGDCTLCPSEWFEAAKQTLGEVCNHMYAAANDSMVRLAKEVQDQIPGWKTVVNDERFNKVLAKKHVLNATNSTSLTEKSGQLHHSIVSIARLGTQWGQGKSKDKDKKDKDKDSDEDRVFAETVFADAKLAVAVRVALKIVLATTGKTQKSDAATFLMKARPGVPATLMAELRKLSGTN